MHSTDAMLALLPRRARRRGRSDTQSYKSAVEPICLKNVKANERIFAGVRQEVRRGKLKPAARRFAKAAAALRETIGELRVVPPPGADRALLGRWLARARQLARAFDVAAVFEFESDHCHLEPSKFT